MVCYAMLPCAVCSCCVLYPDKDSDSKNADELVQLLNIFDKYCPIVEARKQQQEEEEKGEEQGRKQ